MAAAGAAAAGAVLPAGECLAATSVFTPRPAVSFTWRLEGLTPQFFTDAKEATVIKGPCFSACGLDWQAELHPAGDVGKFKLGEAYIYLRMQGAAQPGAPESLSVSLAVNGATAGAGGRDSFAFTPLHHEFFRAGPFVPTLLLHGADDGGPPAITITLRDCAVEQRHGAVQARTNPSLLAVPPPALLTELGSLLASGRGADVTLVCGAERLAAHSFVLSLRSRVFAAQLEGPLAAPADAVPVPPEITPHTLRRLLQYLYTDELEPASPEEASHLLNAADHYAAPRLFAICERALCAALSVDNAATTLTLAEQHGATALKHAALRFVAANALAVMATPGWLHLAAARPALMGEALHTVVAGAPPEPPPREPPAAEDGAGAAAEGGDDAARRVRRRVR